MHCVCVCMCVCVCVCACVRERVSACSCVVESPLNNRTTGQSHEHKVKHQKEHKKEWMQKLRHIAPRVVEHEKE